MSAYFYVGILGDNMADSIANVKVLVKAEGMDKAVKDSAQIANNIERANKAGSQMGGSAAVKSAYKESAASRSAPGAGSAVNEREYGVVRGTVGTGAAGRDFAKQAQGLGGLVALYATFAANIFAVGAAYEALNKAAATERLAKATTMMSISVGADLKGISKNLVEASGHALSFQDAMQFTNIGTSAGLAGAQIESLTKIARGAASALGRDVNDSVRRIIQGTAKQEQEILDELGIFVKSKQAFDKYAKELGVKTEELSGKQRTQAYANEVERLGKKWAQFAEIEDPFSRFAATGKNALNELLNSVNTFVTPILKFLADSKDGVQALIILISTSLAKRALPELGNLFSSIFNYDKQKAATDNAAIVASVKERMTAIKLAITQGNKEIAALNAISPISKESLAAGISSIASVKGKTNSPGVAGLSAQSFNTNLSKATEGYTSLAKIKEAADVEAVMLTTLKKQISAKEDGAKYTQQLIDKGTLANGSLEKGLTLSKEAKVIAASTFANLEQTVLKEASLTNSKKEQATLSKELAKEAKELSRLEGSTVVKRTYDVPEMSSVNSIAANQAEAVSIAQVTAAQVANTAATAAGDTIDRVDVATTTAQTTANNLKAASIAGVTRAQLLETASKNKDIMKDTMSSGMEAIKGSFSLGGLKGLTEGIKTTIGEVGRMGGATKAAAAGLGTMSEATGFWAKATVASTSVSTIFSGSLKILALSIRGIIGALSAALGPLMLLWTAWEIFGDTIKGWLGINDKASKALEEQTKAMTDYREGLGLAGASLKVFSEIQKTTAAEGLSAEIFASDLIISVITNRLAEIKKLKEDAAKTDNETALDKAKKEAAKNNRGFSEGAFNTQALIDTGMLQGEALDAANRTREAYQKLADEQHKFAVNGIVSEYWKNTTAAMEKNIHISADAVLANTAVGKSATEQRARLGEQTAAFDTLTKASEELAKRGKGVRDIATGLHDPTTISFLKAMETSFKGIALAAKPIENVKNMHDALAKSVEGNAKAQALAAPVLALYNALLADPSLTIEKQKEILAAYTDFIVKQTSLAVAATDVKPKSTHVEEYTKKAKEGFRALSREILKTSRESELLELTLKNTKNAQGANESVRGFKTSEESSALKTLEDNKAELGSTTALTKAKLEYNKIQQSNTKSAGEKSDALDLYNATKATIGLKKQENVEANTLANTLDKVKQEQYKINYAYELTKQNLESSAAAASASILIDQAKLDIVRQSGIYSESELASMSANIQLRTLENTQLQQSAAIEAERASKLALNEANITASADARKAKAAEINQLSDYQASSLSSRLLVEQSLLSIKTAQTAEQAKLNDQTKLMVEITTSLSAIFGEMGTNIGKAGEALLKMAQDDGKYAKDKLVISEKISLATAMGVDTTDLVKEQSNLEKKAARDKLSNIATVAGATKKMFKEHTGAYKILEGIEKASHMMKIVDMAKELGTMLSGLATSVAALFTKEAAVGAAKAPNVLMSFVEWMGPWGVAAGAAFLASIGMGGQGASVNLAGLTAADRQETQGTGTAWVNGAKQETGGGVFGDASAKSTSIADSIEIMKNNSIEGLDYDNRMLKAMQRVADAIGTAAESIYQIPGVRLGSAFGTSEGTSGGSFLGWGSSTSTSIQDSGIKLAGSFSQLADSTKNTVKLYETILTQTSSSSWFGLVKSSSSSVSTTTKGIAAENQKAISDIFSNATAVFVEIGKSAGITEEKVLSTLSTLPVNVEASLRGLSGKDLEDALNSTIGIALSDAAKAVFSQFEKYKKFGEDYLATTIRVVDGNNKVNQALKSMGNTFDITAETINKFDISEVLIKAAGGLENFMDRAAEFTSRFLSKEEQIAPIQSSVTQRMKDIQTTSAYSAEMFNIFSEGSDGIIDTKDEFKKLVLAIDLGSTSGRELYTNLMEVQNGFADVADASEDATSKAKEQAKTTRNLVIELLRLEGKATESLNMSRSDELATLSSTDAAIQTRINLLKDEAKLRIQHTNILSSEGKTLSALVATREEELRNMEDILKPGQRYLYALQDELSAKTKLTNAVNNNINSLKANIKTLGDYRDKLSLGASSTLTPTQKYAESKARFFSLADTASQTASTPEEIIKRNEAIAALSTASDTFLGASQASYASSEQYAADFAKVSQVISSTEQNLVRQQTDAEKQLEAVNTVSNILTSIDDSSKTTTTLLQEFLTANAAATLAREVYETSSTLTLATGNLALVDAINANTSLTLEAMNTAEAGAVLRAAAAEAAADARVLDSAAAMYKLLEDQKAAELAAATTAAAAAAAVAAAAAAEAARLAAIKLTVPTFDRGGSRRDSSGSDGPSGGQPGHDGHAGRMAVGGYISGPGTATSDSITTKLSNGEFVIKASSVEKYGKDFLYDINNGKFSSLDNTPVMQTNRSPAAANSTLSNQELIQEIRNLRKEVSLLRDQQSKETGHLISATLESQSQNAKEVSKAVTQATEKQIWTATVAKRAALA